MTTSPLALALAGLLAITSAASAQPIQDEAVDCDLSDNAGAPTALVFGPGGNWVNGTVVTPGDTRTS
jgi:hypothetical protein